MNLFSLCATEATHQYVQPSTSLSSHMATVIRISTGGEGDQNLFAVSEMISPRKSHEWLQPWEADSGEKQKDEDGPKNSSETGEPAQVSVDFLTGNCLLRKHSRDLNLVEDASWGFCRQSEETPQHLLRRCDEDMTKKPLHGKECVQGRS